MLIESLAALIIVPMVAFLLGRLQSDVRFTSLMIFYGIFVAAMTVFSLQDTVVHGSWNAPNLVDSDGEGYFLQAERLVQEGILNFQSVIRSNYLGYQIFLAVLFSIFGINVAVGIIANDVLLLFTIICLYRATLLLTASPRAAMLACAAFMLTTVNIFYGLVLLKEPALCFAFALVLLALTKAVVEERMGTGAVVQVILALAIIVTMRATVLLFLLVLFGFVARILIRRRAHLLIAFVALLGLGVPIAQNFTIYELSSERVTDEITRNNVVSERLQQGDVSVTGVAGRFAGAYVGLPFPAKVALFPVPTIVQLLLPFDFWSVQFLEDHFAFLLFKNFNLIWLLFVAPWFLFAIVNLRRVDRPLIGRLALAGLIYYILVAIIYGGVIPRYATPPLIFIYPAIGYWWARRRDNDTDRDRSSRFFVHYYALFTLAGLGYIAFQLIL